MFLIIATAAVSLGSDMFLAFHLIVGPYQLFGNIFILLRRWNHPRTKRARQMYLVLVLGYFLITALISTQPNPTATLFLIILLYASPVVAILYFGIGVWDYFAFKEDLKKNS